MRTNKAFSRVLALLLCLVLCLSLSLPALAAGGDEVIYLRTAEDLRTFSDRCALDSWSQGKRVILTGDISLRGVDFDPIATFSGTFEGGGHTIRGLQITDELSPAGLFLTVERGAVISGLTVEGQVAPGGTKEFVGGIAGRNEGTISNCYNVGSVSCNSQGELGSIVGTNRNVNFGTVENCYYLNTANNEAVGNGTGTITKTESKTAAEFADGTVLHLLINSRADSEHPWAEKCQYVDAAKMTLPVFKGQGDAHEHSGAWTSNGDGTHSRTCACGVTETAKCSGGTSTCTAKAKCADCGAEYGDTNPNHHGDKLKHVEAKDATTSEEGNIEYWYCEACEKYFSDADAKNEITQAQTVIPKRQSSGSKYSYYTIKATAGAGGSISPSGNVSVREGRDQTFTITPDKGYAVSNVKIDGKSIGAVKSYTFENVSRTHTIEVIFMKANGNPQTGVFVDVATGSYYEDAVNWATENGITQGTDDTHFSPDGICTRAQAVTFLWRTAGSPEPETRTMPFTDVPVGSYYYDAVLWAVENGITEGTSDTTFSPNMTCSRAQIVTFLRRSGKSPAAGTANPFADVKSTAYYAGAVLWAVKENITKGTTNTTFSPDADCTRAQIVTFLWRCKK